jgi:four helix bundle protein
MDRVQLRNRTFRFAIRAVRFCRTLPDTWEARRIGGQLLDSATSVAMNYRAAGRGRSRAEFIAKLGIAVEEADETLGWLELIVELELAKGPELLWLIAESQELLAILAASQKTAKENRQRIQSTDREIDRRSPNPRS